jgi:hypothetical protein
MNALDVFSGSPFQMGTSCYALCAVDRLEIKRSRMPLTSWRSCNILEYVSSWLSESAECRCLQPYMPLLNAEDNRGINTYHVIKCGRSWIYELTCGSPDPKNMKRVRKAPELRKQSTQELEQAELANFLRTAEGPCMLKGPKTYDRP